jgi:hypothetical protein
MRPDKWPNDVRFAARMRAERWAELTGLGILNGEIGYIILINSVVSKLNKRKIALVDRFESEG